MSGTPQARGLKSTLCLDFEDEFGKDPAVKAALQLPINSYGVKATRQKQTTNTLTGTRNPVEPYDGFTAVSGQVVVPVDSETFGYWLAATFGAPTTSNSNGVYSHLFKIKDSQPSILTDRFFNTTAPLFFKQNGLKVDKLSMSLGGQGELVATLQIEGASEVKGGEAYDSAPTIVSLKKRFSNFMASVLDGGGQPIGNVSSLKFDLAMNLDKGDDKYCLGNGGFRSDLPEGIVGISGTVTTLLKDSSLIDKGFDSTKCGLVAKLSYDDDTDLTWTFPELQYQLTSPTIDGPAGVKVDMAFVGYLSTDPGQSAVQVLLRNAYPEYHL